MAKKTSKVKSKKRNTYGASLKGGKVISLKDRVFEGKNFPKAKDATLPKLKLSKAEIAEIQREAKDPNKWWNRTTTVGRERIFSDPDAMWHAACEYFEFQSKRHWIKQEWKSDKEVGLMQVETKIDAPFTLEGMCLFLGTYKDYFYNFMVQLKEDDPNIKEFTRVVQRIAHVIRTQKFEGAAVGTYKENLISYDLGFKKDVNVVANAQANGVSIEVKDGEQKTTLSDVMKRLDAIDVEAEDVKPVKNK